MNPHPEPTIFRLSRHPGCNPLEFDGIGKQKINYRIHTDAIKGTLIPPSITKARASAVYASDANLLNVALFGQANRKIVFAVGNSAAHLN
ncbi:MAG: hypothetical protein MUF04_00465 [Akkermansiaceae bacterium]|jgi:hypothetical protein|nr:hypothetical protein [Akkermansiaceae bacterium]